jgi:hypothetical protein
VLVTGDRHWTDKYLVALILHGCNAIADSYDEVLYVIEGGANGADEAAREWCKDRDEVECITVEAEWTKLGKAAGPLRNIKMLDEHDPELVLAFHNDLARSKGTKHCVEEAEKRGLLIYRFTSPQ